jgi:hypothetical protein
MSLWKNGLLDSCADAPPQVENANTAAMNPLVVGSDSSLRNHGAKAPQGSSDLLTRQGLNNVPEEAPAFPRMNPECPISTSGSRTSYACPPLDTTNLPPEQTPAGFGRDSHFDSMAAEAEDRGESGHLNRVMRRALSLCAKRNKLTCVRISTDGEPKTA